jgi:lysine biosynthesis protein LysW
MDRQRLILRPPVYNTPSRKHDRDEDTSVPASRKDQKEVVAVVRCPECATEIDVDEDEVEEGEIVNCPECERELEVVQVHPVHLNLISDELEDEDDEEEEEEEEEEDDEEESKVDSEELEEETEE